MTYVLLLDGNGKILYVDEELLGKEIPWDTVKILLEGQDGNVIIDRENYHFRRVSIPLGERGLHIVKLLPMEDSLLRIFSTFIHEFKNPLGAIRALAQALGRRMTGHPEGEKVKEYIEMMIKEIDRLNTLVGSFKYLSRPTVRFMVPFDMREVVREAVSLYREEFSQRGVFLELEEGDEVPYFGNPDDFHQITANLLRNALDASSKGGRVWVKVEEEDGVRIEVLDAGEGISDEALEHLRRGEPYTSKAKGMGMGLYVVNHLLRKYKGSLVVERRPGGGTRARVQLPRVMTSEGGPLTGVPPGEKLGRGGRGWPSKKR